jgi:cytochrome d ubiquinol oxidase subunit II
MLFDYITLKLIWWLFVCLLLIGFAVMDGFDMGIAALLPFLARNDDQRRVMINAIAPTWEANQVWFIATGGALFAAWPMVYATAFSALYWVLFLALFALFLRPVGFDYRSKVNDPRWRTAWDWGLFVGGVVPALVFGMAFGNLLQGVPFEFDQYMRSTYTGSFRQLLNPFALLAGVVSLTMLVMHGAVFMQLRTEGELNERARKAVRLFGVIFIVAFLSAGLWQFNAIDGYRIVSMPDPGTALTPLSKSVEAAPGAWSQNYVDNPLTLGAPAAALAGALLAMILSTAGRPGVAFIFSAISLAGVIMTAALAMFPFVMPSSSVPNASLTAYDVVSSHGTLNLMFIAVLLFMPIVIAYTSWAYRVMRGKITEQKIRQETHTAY